MRKFSVLMLVFCCLTSCATYYNSTGEKKYLQSRNGPNVVVPSPLTRNNVSEFYTLPEQTQDAKISVEPPKAS